MADTTSFCDFYGREFLVSKDTLIPRPETEGLIDELLRLSGKPYLPGLLMPEAVISRAPVILDVGTGSGCIAVTAAKEIPNAKVYGIDISEGALKIAQENAKRLNAEVEFIKSDLLAEYAGPEPEVLLANLPYVDPGWEWLDKKALAAEPDTALYAGDGGLFEIKRLITELWERDFHPYVILEADPCQHQKIIEFAKAEVLKDEGFILSLKF